jgi:hypothetical protein
MRWLVIIIIIIITNISNKTKRQTFDLNSPLSCPHIATACGSLCCTNAVFDSFSIMTLFSLDNPKLPIISNLSNSHPISYHIIMYSCDVKGMSDWFS